MALMVIHFQFSSRLFNLPNIPFLGAHIMHQHIGVADIISMEILNLEVICYLWTFKQFMLYLLYNNILAIEHNENIASSKINRACPTLFGDIERVLRF